MTEIEKLKKILTDHEERIKKLEGILGSKPDDNYVVPNKKTSYEGVSGGIRFLIDNNFFVSPKSSNEVYDELKKEGYYTSPKTADASLRKSFVASKKILTRIKENNVWKYVIRK